MDEQQNGQTREQLLSMGCQDTEHVLPTSFSVSLNISLCHIVCVYDYAVCVSFIAHILLQCVAFYFVLSNDSCSFYIPLSRQLYSDNKRLGVDFQEGSGDGVRLEGGRWGHVRTTEICHFA